jgi:ATP/maltotriose-dependent transcriptional regulator MalT
MQLDEAIGLLDECQVLLDQYGFRPQAYVGTDPLTQLGMAHLFQGNFEAALNYCHRAVANADRYNDLPNLGWSNRVLGMAYLAVGQLEEARQYGQLALSQSKQTGNLAICAHCTDHLGDTAMVARDPAMAEIYFAEGYHYRLEINERPNLPQSMALLGKAKLAQGRYAEAAEWLEKCISLYTTYGDTANLIVPKSQLALCFGYMNNTMRARDLFMEAIYVAELAQVVPLWLILTAHIGEFLIQLGDEESGVRLLSTVVHHPMFDRGRGMAVDVQKRLSDFEKTMLKDRYDAALKAGINTDFEATVHALEHDLNSTVLNALPVTPAKRDRAEFYAKGLEPLSDRELEVLGLIAVGLTNQEIAQQLIVTVGTVKSHTHNIYSKLGVKNRAQAIKLARELNLI